MLRRSLRRCSRALTPAERQLRRAQRRARSHRAAPASSRTRPRYDDQYADVPASLELAYTDADLGLSPRRLRARLPVRARPTRRAAADARVRRVGRELAETVILAVLIFFAVKAVIQNFRVEGASMEPSLHNKQYLLVNKAIYFRVDMDRVHDFLPFIPGDDGEERHLFRAPRRGDVIVFQLPARSEPRLHQARHRRARRHGGGEGRRRCSSTAAR